MHLPASLVAKVLGACVVTGVSARCALFVEGELRRYAVGEGRTDVNHFGDAGLQTGAKDVVRTRLVDLVKMVALPGPELPITCQVDHAPSTFHCGAERGGLSNVAFAEAEVPCQCL